MTRQLKQDDQTKTIPIIAVTALATPEYGDYDAALLEINLNGEQVYPVGDILSTRNIPYLFLSGYDDQDMPIKYSEQPKLGKPFNQHSCSTRCQTSSVKGLVSSEGVLSD